MLIAAHYKIRMHFFKCENYWAVNAALFNIPEYAIWPIFNTFSELLLEGMHWGTLVVTAFFGLLPRWPCIWRWSWEGRVFRGLSRTRRLGWRPFRQGHPCSWDHGRGCLKILEKHEKSGKSRADWIDAWLASFFSLKQGISLLSCVSCITILFIS